MNRTRATAPETEYIINFGGTPLISLMAFLATSGGCTLGFSGWLRDRKTAGGAAGMFSTSADSAGLEAGRNTSLSGGRSSRSEKLTGFFAPGASPAIMGSTAHVGSTPVSGLTAAAIFAYL